MKAKPKLHYVELRYDDGAILILEGSFAQEWKERVDGDAFAAWNHVARPDSLPWKRTTLASPSTKKP